MIQVNSVTEARRAKVLVVEDEVLLRFPICLYLRDEGLTVLEAASADEALDVLRSDPDIGLVFSDVRMPGSLDGLGLARTIQSEFPHVHILLASGHMLRTGVDVAFLTKPYDFADVAGRIKAAVDGAAG